MPTKKILMVCLGNICRSPMAEGILRDMVRKNKSHIETDSAGTNNYHTNEPPDERAQEAMKGHGVDISDLRARQVRSTDFNEFDLILAMDESNLRNIRSICTDASLLHKAQLIMDHAPEHPEREVPDPYYGGKEGFEGVYQMLTLACDNLMQKLKANGAR